MAAVSDNEFLNPKSMLTPGLAGSVIMLISNTLWIQFGLQQKWSALLLSFLLVSLMIWNYTSPLFHKFIYFLLNGLFVFSMAVGINTGIQQTVDTKALQRSAAPVGSGARTFRFQAEPTPPQKEREFLDVWFK